MHSISSSDSPSTPSSLAIVLTNIATCLMNLNNPTHAQTAASRAILEDNSNAKAHFRLGQAQLALGQNPDLAFEVSMQISVEIARILHQTDFRPPPHLHKLKETLSCSQRSPRLKALRRKALVTQSPQLSYPFPLPPSPPHISPRLSYIWPSSNRCL